MRCSVKGCQIAGNSLLFRFPSTLPERQQWFEALHVDSSRTGDRVCFKHFKPSDLLTNPYTVRTRLKKGAVPSLELPPKHIDDLRPKVTLVKKTYECAICDEKYTNLMNLHKHVQTHGQNYSITAYVQKEKPFECDLCDMKFYYAYGLEKHKTEDHESLHTCDACDKRFNNEKNLSAHKLLEHQRNKPPIECVEKPKPYRCGRCGLTFHYHYGLSKHKCYKKVIKEKNFGTDKIRANSKDKQELTKLDQPTTIKILKVESLHPEAKKMKLEADEVNDPLNVNTIDSKDSLHPLNLTNVKTEAEVVDNLGKDEDDPLLVQSVSQDPII